MLHLNNRRCLLGVCFAAFLATVVLFTADKPLAGGTPAVDPDPRIRFAYDQIMDFGIAVVKDAAGKAINNKLTYAVNGSTNSTIVQIDKKVMQFGGPAGKWLEKDVKAGAASRSVWAVGGVRFIQILEVVP